MASHKKSDPDDELEPGKLNEKESRIMKKLDEANNLYEELEVQHPSDLEEWVQSMHDLQEKILIRPTIRAEGLEVDMDELQEAYEDAMEEHGTTDNKV